MSLKYRPEIDGLRAIAVLSVILFHLQVAGFAGGFIGVDVFFVISGYLITGIILQDYNAGQFTFADFYKRRIRRIMPLTVVVYACTLLVSYLLFFSEQYKSVNHVLKSSLLFVSNFLLLRKPGYFDPSMQENPFLHTWSLSVEEQFYIFFPLGIYLLLRYVKGGYKYGLVVIAVLSFIANIIVTAHNPQKAFYWPHTRAWQLMCGAILATGLVKTTLKQWLNNLLSIAGVLMIIAGVVLYREGIVYPGWNAVLPVVGACCIIYGAASGTVVNMLLAYRPMVFVGKISYSLYMWHWPIWVFASFLVIGPLSLAQKAMLIAVTFIVSYASYRLVEQPFRSKKAVANPFTVWGIACSSVLLLLLALLFIKNHDGISRTGKANYDAAINSKGDKIWKELHKLEAANKKDFTQLQPYRLGADTSAPTFLLWGDSHARALAPGVDAVAKENGAAGYVLCASSCPPLLGLRFADDMAGLQAFNENTMLFIEHHPEIKTIILSARWTSYYTDPYIVADKLEQSLAKPEEQLSQQRLFCMGLSLTIEGLKALGRNVIVIEPLPELKATVNEMLVIQKLFGTGRKAFSESNTSFYTSNNDFLTTMRNRCNGVTLLNLSGNLFAQSPLVSDSIVLYRDRNHLSETGAYHVAAGLTPYLK